MFPRASTDRIPLKAKDSSVVLCVLGMYTALGLVPSMFKKNLFRWPGCHYQNWGWTWGTLDYFVPMCCGGGGTVSGSLKVFGGVFLEQREGGSIF